jgi:deoxyhypusine synthase
MAKGNMHASPISKFINEYFRHFNAASLREAAEAYKRHLKNGGKMLVALGGAMSTAEIGLSLAEMIRQDKVHAISCTGANLEEDIFNLVLNNLYEHVPNYRHLSIQDEKQLFERNLNRITDVCVPDNEIWNRLEQPFLNQWHLAEKNGERYFPHEFVYRILRSGEIKQHYQIDPRNSWVLAAMERNLPIFVPGWEDSSTGNMFAGACIRGEIKKPDIVRSGIECMIELSKWYSDASLRNSIGFFQIGGGIAGDFPICVVPMLHQDLLKLEIPKWGYFCQISDSTTSYGSYSGAVPNEKITWGKLGADTPSYIIESDATIVAPLIFAFVLDW